MQVRQRRNRQLRWVGSLVGLLLCVTALSATAEPKKFTLINVLLEGTKIWLPSSVVVYEGEEVELTLLNKLDEPHGFQIEAFGIEEVVQPKAQATVKFTAARAGAYSYLCQMHPPHLGGTVIVLNK